jgi:hypothetical protein
MDVVFAIDTTGSMEDVLDSVKNSLTNTLNSIVMASLGDYRIGLVTFDGYSDNCINGCGFYGDFVCVRDVLASTNRDQIANDILNLQVGDGYGRAECSDEALNTVINTLSATDPNRNQCGDFTTPFRPQARKIIILVTDAEPGSFQDYYNDTVQSNAFERAAQAVANGIEISAVNVDWYNNGIRDQMMHYYADTTGGVYARWLPSRPRHQSRSRPVWNIARPGNFCPRRSIPALCSIYCHRATVGCRGFCSCRF